MNAFPFKKIKMYLAYKNKGYLIIAFDKIIKEARLDLLSNKLVIYSIKVVNTDFLKIPLDEIPEKKIDKIVFKTDKEQISKALYF